MQTMTYETYMNDSTAREAVERAARRARVEAMNEFLIKPLLRFCGSLLRVPTVTGRWLQPQ
jgi:hypothetical protein